MEHRQLWKLYRPNINLRNISLLIIVDLWFEAFEYCEQLLVCIHKMIRMSRPSRKARLNETVDLLVYLMRLHLTYIDIQAYLLYTTLGAKNITSLFILS